MVTFGGYTVLGVKRAHVYVGATGDRTGHAVVLLKLAHLRTWQARRLPRAGLLPPNPVPRFPRGTSKSCASSSGARAAPALERARPRTYVQGAQLVGLRARLFPALMRTCGRRRDLTYLRGGGGAHQRERDHGCLDGHRASVRVLVCRGRDAFDRRLQTADRLQTDSPPLADRQLRGIEHHVPDVQPHPRVRHVHLAVARLPNTVVRTHRLSAPVAYCTWLPHTDRYDYAAPT